MTKVEGSATQMIWVDFETTGLNPATEVPLEVGVILTDYEGHEIASKVSLLAVPTWSDLLANAVPEVREMHGKSGLRLDLATASQDEDFYKEYAPHRVATDFCEWLINDMGLEAKIFPMGGSTIFFDREFMRVWMPELYGFFHYRNVDISTLKNLCKLLNPGLYAALPNDKEKTHRPLDDIRHTLAEYRFYLDNFLHW